MAEVKTPSEENQNHSSSLPSKRKPNLEKCLEEEDLKKQKPAPPPPSNEKEEEEEEEEEEDEDDDDVEDGEEEEEEVVVDRKGKGIMKEGGDNKGKGKQVLVEEEEEESDSDLSDISDVSDLSNDPLTEVDLDNILPSRTRRRVRPPPGAYEVNDLDGDDSDDSDA
ncbi:hypothetical protein IFM89_031225 [Coptis chinensis]|uniref:Uncharacterized protein n=1 Tax=Coptis chinensis TaxID=261450 RepID=A0A835ITK3_9MAGN|nr:hypothetical protein IFM89_031225 [Coptis chinensis]